MTYPDSATDAFLSEHVVAYKPKIDEQQELAKRFGVTWTPGLVWLTPDGKACHRNVGFFDPEELQAEVLFGCGQVAAGQSDWAKARERFEEVATRWPGSKAAPAALYWLGVSAKKVTGEVAPLLKAWKKLQRNYPESSWAMKVSFLNDDN